MSKITNKLIDHDFDGIQEYDNDLPGWWKALFLITIIFSIIYVPYYHLFGDLQDAEYQKEMGTYTEVDSKRGTMTAYKSPYASERSATVSETKASVSSDESTSGDVAATSSETTPEVSSEAVALLTDETNLAAGKTVWETMCFSCHLADGGGSIGPNMTDNYWIHGGDLASIINIINVGVPAKGMISWTSTLTAEQIHQVASFIQVKLVGSSPAAPKASEGELYEG